MSSVASMNPDPAKKIKLGSLTGALLRSWFELTSQEQSAVALVLFLFTLGVIVRFCRVCMAT